MRCLHSWRRRSYLEEEQALEQNHLQFALNKVANFHNCKLVTASFPRLRMGFCQNLVLKKEAASEVWVLSLTSFPRKLRP